MKKLSDKDVMNTLGFAAAAATSIIRATFPSIEIIECNIQKEIEYFIYNKLCELELIERAKL